MLYWLLLLVRLWLLGKSLRVWNLVISKSTLEPTSLSSLCSPSVSMNCFLSAPSKSETLFVLSPLALFYFILFVDANMKKEKKKTQCRLPFSPMCCACMRCAYFAYLAYLAYLAYFAYGAYGAYCVRIVHIVRDACVCLYLERDDLCARTVKLPNMQCFEKGFLHVYLPPYVASSRQSMKLCYRGCTFSVYLKPVQRLVTCRKPENLKTWKLGSDDDIKNQKRYESK